MMVEMGHYSQQSRSHPRIAPPGEYLKQNGYTLETVHETLGEKVVSTDRGLGQATDQSGPVKDCGQAADKRVVESIQVINKQGNHKVLWLIRTKNSWRLNTAPATFGSPGRHSVCAIGSPHENSGSSDSEKEFWKSRQGFCEYHTTVDSYTQAVQKKNRNTRSNIKSPRRVNLIVSNQKDNPACFGRSSWLLSFRDLKLLVRIQIVLGLNGLIMMYIKILVLKLGHSSQKRVLACSFDVYHDTNFLNIWFSAPDFSCT